MDNVIDVKSKDFAVRIIRFYKYLTDEKKEYDIARQILRSGTSIGANIRESRNAQSRKDFIAKRFIALKEADETAYWLEILGDAEIVQKNQIQDLYDACIELVKMLTSSLKTLRNEGEKHR